MTSNTFNEIPHTPFGCKYQDDSLSFSQRRISWQLFFLILAIVLYLSFATFEAFTESRSPLSAFSQLFSMILGFISNTQTFLLGLFDGTTSTSQIQTVLFWGLLILTAFGIFCYLLSVKKTYRLNHEGFHITEKYSYHSDSSQSLIPLNKIRMFRLQNDESSSFVELITTEKIYCILHSSRETKLQRWVVSAGNKILSNLTNSYCASLGIQDDVYQDADSRFNCSDSLCDIVKPENTTWTANNSQDGLQLEYTGTFSMDFSTFRDQYLLTSLVLIIASIGLAFLMEAYIPYSRSRGSLHFGFSGILFMLSFAGLIGLIYSLKELFGRFLNQQWSFNGNSVTRKQSRFGFLSSQRTFDLMDFKYIQILKQDADNEYRFLNKDSNNSDGLNDSFFLNLFSQKDSHAENKDPDEDQRIYHLVLSNRNDRRIFSIKNLTLKEAYWIASLILQELR